MLEHLLAHGSLVLVFATLIAAGVGVPVSEDVALLAAGILARRGVQPLGVVLVVGYAGVVTGDALLFFTARKLGRAAYERRFFQRILPPARREKLEHAFARYGGAYVFFARHLPGLRAPVFALAGIHGMRPSRFFAWDALAACFSVPAMIGLGYFASDQIDRVLARLSLARNWVLGLAVAGLVVAIVVSRLRRRRDGLRR